MKRFISLFFALLLALSCLGCAHAEGVTFKTNYYTLTLQEGWTVSMEDANSEMAENLVFLGGFYAPKAKDLVVEAWLAYYEDLKDKALWNGDEAFLQEYIDIVLDDYAEDNAVYLDTVMADKIPFVLIKCEDAEGEYLYADTMSNGYAIVFYAYVTDYDAEKTFPLKDADIEQFKAILSTFKPVK
ncbi:MAG: hypothetical protein IKQ41_06485 [Clostridia bacterium]|nr:hypothetical protein [Clostridia bacterium]